MSTMQLNVNGVSVCFSVGTPDLTDSTPAPDTTVTSPPPNRDINTANQPTADTLIVPTGSNPVTPQQNLTATSNDQQQVSSNQEVSAQPPPYSPYRPGSSTGGSKCTVASIRNIKLSFRDTSRRFRNK